MAYIPKSKGLYAVAVYELQNGDSEDFRISLICKTMDEASHCGTLECQYYIDHGYELDYHGWANGYGAKNKYLWQLSRGNDFVSIIASISAFLQ